MFNITVSGVYKTEISLVLSQRKSVKFAWTGSLKAMTICAQNNHVVEVVTSGLREIIDMFNLQRGHGPARRNRTPVARFYH
jgi:hypothetical protein